MTQTVRNVIPGWQAFDSDQQHPYVGVSFSEGAPDQKTVLAPTTEKKIKGGTLAVWKFPVSATGYWVSCLYAETSATIATKLANDIRSCEVEYDGRFSLPVAKRWHCGSRAKK